MTGRRVRHGLTDVPGGASGRWPSDHVATGTVYSPSRIDPVARAASTVIGGPAGRRLASTPGFWGAVPVLVLLAAAMLSFGLVQKEHCRAEGWTSPDQFWHACYSDIPVLYGSAGLGGAERLGLVDSLGSDGGLGQSPLAGAVMWVTSAVVSDSSPNAARHFFDLTAVGLTLALAVAVTAVALLAGRRSWDAAHLALSPVLITTGLISYQLLAVALVAAALLVFARGRPLIGGLLLGLGIATAPQVAVIGLVIPLLASRYLRAGIAPAAGAERPDIDSRPAVGVGLVFGAAALGGWLFVRVLLLPGYVGELGTAWKNWVDSVPGYGSLWLAPQLLGASEPDPASSLAGRAFQGLFGWLFKIGSLGGTATSILSLVLLAVLSVVILRFTLIADQPTEKWVSPEFPDAEPSDDAMVTHSEAEPGAPGPAADGVRGELTAAAFITDKAAPLALALLAAVLLTAKMLPVQTSLLLLPLIALSGLRWRDHLIWAGTELVYFVGVWLYIAGESTSNRGLPATFYLIMLLARLAGIAWIGTQGVLAYRSSKDAESVPHEPVDNPVYGPDPVDRFLPS